MYISLYRRYRPQTFSDVVGQEAAVGVLLEALKEGTLGHAYLFSGPRGCGKTTAARLVAKSLDCSNRGANCEPCGECDNCRAIAAGEHLDVIEIDGATNRGIDEIRDLKSRVSLKALTGSYKVYIIDEVHMLTDQAFNALLKTLEEPPANVVFILATTEPNKVPVTIRSRCQHIPFHRITAKDIVSRLKYICERENISFEDEALWEVARQADGALRDALSVMEQAVVLGSGSLTAAGIKELTGGGSRSELEKWVTMLRTDACAAARTLHSVMSHGISPERLCESLFILFRDLWLCNMWKSGIIDSLEVSDEERAYLETEAEKWDRYKLEAICTMLSKLLPRTHYGMKSDIFAGLVLLEIQNIINGTAKMQPSPTAAPENALTRTMPQPRPAAVMSEFTQNAETNRPQHDARIKSELDNAAANFGSVPKPTSAPAAEVRKNARQPEIKADLSIFGSSKKNDADESESSKQLAAKLGSGDFSRLVSNLNEDAVEIASALLYAELKEKDGEIIIEFENPMPAQTFLSVERNRQNVIQAASKTWGIEIKQEENEENIPAKNEPQKDEQIQPAKPEPQKNDTKKESKAESAPQISADISRVLRLAGAEILYVKSASGGEEEAEPTEETAE